VLSSCSSIDMVKSVQRAVLVAALIAALAYLRDPPWLVRMESGFRRWETATDGTRYRSIAGHASFFVPADAKAIVIPARTTFADREDPPVEISIAIDDRPADAFVLREGSWKRAEIRLPPPGRRRLRRIDVRVDRVRKGLRGAEIGEVTVLR
jgi:hypothetical protein